MAEPGSSGFLWAPVLMPGSDYKGLPPMGACGQRDDADPAPCADSASQGEANQKRACADAWNAVKVCAVGVHGALSVEWTMA